MAEFWQRWPAKGEPQCTAPWQHREQCHTFFSFFFLFKKSLSAPFLFCFLGRFLCLEKNGGCRRAGIVDWPDDATKKAMVAKKRGLFFTSRTGGSDRSPRPRGRKRKGIQRGTTAPRAHCQSEERKTGQPRSRESASKINMDDSACFMDCVGASPATAQHNNVPPGLDTLPLESLLHILSYLGTRDVGACAMAGRAMAFACDDRSLWVRLRDREQAIQEARWRTAAESVAAAVSLCSDWSRDQITKGKSDPQRILDGIVADIGCMVKSPWHASVDLTRLLGHPRLACAAYANVRVLVDDFQKAPSRACALSSGRATYASVGTIVRCTGARYMCRSRVTIQRGFFDTDGILCGPGLTQFYSHHSETGNPAWLGCVGLWSRGRVYAHQQDGDAIYKDGCRYRGNLLDDFCHGQGRIHSADGSVLAAGQWKRNVAHGPCSWRQNFYESGGTQTRIGNAAFIDGLVDGPIAYFAEGRLVMRIPRPYPRRPFADFAEKCAFLSGGEKAWVHLSDYAAVWYGPAGVTIKSDLFFAHRWTDGALTLGDAQRYYSNKAPRLFVVFEDDSAGTNGAPLLIALGNDATFSDDPHTLAVTMRGGQKVDARYRRIIDRDPIATGIPAGLEPDGDAHDAHVRNMACGVVDSNGDARSMRVHDHDHNLATPVCMRHCLGVAGARGCRRGRRGQHARRREDDQHRPFVFSRHGHCPARIGSAL
nr:pentapeptide repeat [Pandoravirus massiliensis]